ncbi:MAG: hypothetical protein K6G84_07535 [Lachnospiraceae bacterium]|nr:hypothetical protein [Lachnospiraceae bacterium]
MVEITIVISFVSLIFAMYAGINSLVRNRRIDDQKNASELATAIAKLNEIGHDTSEIKNDLREVKNDVKKQDEFIIRIDESLKSAWRVINKMQDKKDGEEDE